MKKKSLFISVLTIMMFLSSSITVYAAVSWPSINNNKPIKAFTINTANNTSAYSDSTFKRKVGTIDASDELSIQSIYQNRNEQWGCEVTYLTARGRKTAHILLSAITSATEVSGRYIATASITSYRRALASLKAGSISKGDTVYKLTEQGSYVQVLYNIGSVSNPSRWRMAWVTMDDFNKYVQAVGVNPHGCLDSVVSNQSGKITIKGWAFDRDNLTCPIDIHVYVGEPAESGAPRYVVTANTSRSDVNNAYAGVGNYHGFDSNISVDITGTKTVYVYACNVGGGTNVLLGTRTITIQSNTANMITNIPKRYVNMFKMEEKAYGLFERTRGLLILYSNNAIVL